MSVLFAVVLVSSAGNLVAATDSRWTQMMPAQAPSVRIGHDMAYDSESDRVILFGGETAPGSNVLNDETWAYDLNSNTWEDRSPSPSPSSRFAYAMAYDADSDRVILFGGWTGEEQSNETWAYDYNTNVWTNKTPASSLPPGVFVEMAYDAESDRIILFGGGMDREGGGLRAETWAYDFDSNRWTKMNPAASPRPRGSHGMAYDSASDRIVLFGGRDPGQDFGDTWTYDYDNDTWTQMSPETSPSPRHGLAMAYDAGLDGIVLFGGVTTTGDTQGGDETWVYNFNSDTWRQAEKGSGPSRRFGAVMADDTASDTVVLLGGSAGGNETWTWSNRIVASPPFALWVFVSAGLAIGATAAVVAALMIRRGKRKRRGEP